MANMSGTDQDWVLIDLHFQETPEAIASWLVRGSEGWAIIDCGPSTSQPALEAGIAAAGLAMRDISCIVLTHIHLDHGGGAGTLLRDHPHLRVSVHQDAAQVMIDPTRLIRSASMSFGERMQRLWGEIIGVDPDRIDPILPGDIVPGTRLWAIATPGHTATHLSFLDLDNGTLYAGDAAHARLPNSDVIVPTLAPIELDFDAWHATATKLRRLAPTRLALPHFGEVRDVDAHLDQIEERIRTRLRIAELLVQSPQDVDALTEAILQASREEYTANDAAPDQRLASMELAMPSYLGAQGILRWYKVHGVLMERPE